MREPMKINRGRRAKVPEPLREALRPAYRETTTASGRMRVMVQAQETTANGRPHGALTVRVIAMPADTNANGDIFGGWVLSRMDQAGGIAAVERAKGRAVTIAIEAMTFIRPVRVGDVLEVYTQIEKFGRTSMKIHIEAWARRFMTHHHEKVTDANFTFVAIDDAGRPRPIPRDGIDA